MCLNPCSPLPDQVYSSMLPSKTLMPSKIRKTIFTEKVAYAPAIKTPTEPAKCEIRNVDDMGKRR